MSAMILRRMRPALQHLNQKESQEFLIPMSHCLLLILFYLRPLHTFSYYHGHFPFILLSFYSIFQSQFKGCLLTHFLVFSSELVCHAILVWFPDLFFILLTQYLITYIIILYLSVRSVSVSQLLEAREHSYFVHHLFPEVSPRSDTDRHCINIC